MTSGYGDVRATIDAGTVCHTGMTIDGRSKAPYGSACRLYGVLSLGQLTDHLLPR
jgi:hypothetical protein